ncbi:MAG: LemA family protein [Xenococcaceae cyanobacterium]
MAPEVLELAARLYAQQQSSYSVADLIQAGAEAEIPPELIEQAIEQVQARRREEQAQRQRDQELRKQLLLGLCGVAAVVLLWGGWTYNSLTGAANQVDAAGAQVENQLQRRADLIPQLVKVTEAYAQQERELVTMLVQSGSSYLQASTLAEKAAATAQMNSAIARFQTYFAANPQLQSSQLFVNLQYEIAGTENRIATERMRYNKAVQAYNQKVRSFPNSLITNLGDMKPKEFFQAHLN